MKDEEKRIFEKWFEEKKEKCEVYGNGDDFWVDDEIKKFCLMGYELGLKAGRPQWHDLQKDPNDLPKKEGCYLVCMEFNYRHTYMLNYGQDDYDDEEKMDWYDDESTHYPKEVIAWCEIPTFDKEIE